MYESENWNRVVVDVRTTRPSGDLLRRLVDGDVAVVVLRNLLPDEVFAENRARLREVFDSASTTTYANGALTTIGPYLAKYLDDFEGYLQAAKEAKVMLEGVSFDLAQHVRDGLRVQFGLSSLEPAAQPGRGEYAESVIRIHADGVRNPLHNDNIMRDAAGTEVALQDLAYQLSCVVCIQECDSGGELRIYRKPWAAADEQYKIQSGLGYDEQVVRDVPGHEFRPQANDVYLINPTRYHSIERVSGSDRLTMGFFIGFADDSLDSAVVWG
ncbi:hypothetical protein [Micromonospora sp. NPDC049004]|uniref:2OG-Fe(II)-dependent halogenase WelO5 family protein n=1 Tax=unclassified Micromonospora TaxID=2617518 RepID=UPI0033C31504